MFFLLFFYIFFETYLLYARSLYSSTNYNFYDNSVTLLISQT